MWHVFSPLVVLTGLLALKILLFRVKPLALYLVTLMGLVTVPIFMESYFDHHLHHYPLWMTALPFCLIMIAVVSHQFYSVFWGSDVATSIFYGYRSKLKRAMTIINIVSIVCVSVSFICSLYFLEASFTNHAQGKSFFFRPLCRRCHRVGHPVHNFDLLRSDDGVHWLHLLQHSL